MDIHAFTDKKGRAILCVYYSFLMNEEKRLYDIVINCREISSGSILLNHRSHLNNTSNHFRLLNLKIVPLEKPDITIIAFINDFTYKVTQEGMKIIDFKKTYDRPIYFKTLTDFYKVQRTLEGLVKISKFDSESLKFKSRIFTIGNNTDAQLRLKSFPRISCSPTTDSSTTIGSCAFSNKDLSINYLKIPNNFFELKNHTQLNSPLLFGLLKKNKIQAKNLELDMAYNSCFSAVHQFYMVTNCILDKKGTNLVYFHSLKNEDFSIFPKSKSIVQINGKYLSFKKVSGYAEGETEKFELISRISEASKMQKLWLVPDEVGLIEFNNIGSLNKNIEYLKFDFQFYGAVEKLSGRRRIGFEEIFEVNWVVSLLEKLRIGLLVTVGLFVILLPVFRWLKG